MTDKWVHWKAKIGESPRPTDRFFYDLLLPVWGDVGAVKSSLLGTAVVVEHKDALFLITALHVLEGATRPRLHLGGKLTRLLGQQITINLHTGSVQRTPDVAIVRLDEGLAQSVRQEKTLVQLSVLRWPQRMEPPIIVAGFIISQSRHVPSHSFVKEKILVQELEIQDGEGGTGLHLPRKRADGSNMPEPQGLSGAPILYIAQKRLYIMAFNCAGLPQSGESLMLGYVPAQIVLAAISSADDA